MNAHSCLQRKHTHQEVIGDGPHAFMRQNNPNHHYVTNHRHRNDAAISDSPQRDLPHRLDELVEAVAGVRGDVCPVGGVELGGVEQRVHLLCIGSFVKNRIVSGCRSRFLSRTETSSACECSERAVPLFCALQPFLRTAKPRAPEDITAPKRTTQPPNHRRSLGSLTPDPLPPLFTLHPLTHPLTHTLSL